MKTRADLEKERRRFLELRERVAAAREMIAEAAILFVETNADSDGEAKSLLYEAVDAYRKLEQKK